MNHLDRNFRRKSYKALSNEPSFYASLTHNLVLTKGQGVATFTRATTKTITDFEGLIKTIKSGEAGFEGARRVENGVVQNMSLWSKFGSATVDDVGSGVYRLNFSGTSQYVHSNSSIAMTIGRTETKSVWLKTESGTGTIKIRSVNSASDPNARVTVTSEWQRFSVTGVLVGSASGNLAIGRESASDTLISVLAKFPQYEDVTGQSNTNPSEYVSSGVLSAPYHGAGVNGVKYFTTQNGNTVNSNVVTEATGSAIPEATLKGVSIEVASSNLCLYNDFSSGWSGTANILQSGLVSYDGSLTAASVTESIFTNLKQLTSPVASFTSGTTYTQTWKLKAGTATAVQIQFGNSHDSNSWANFDLTNGVLGTVGTSATAKITSLGNGWWLCSITADANNTTSTAVAAQLVCINNNPASGKSPTYTGTDKVFYAARPQTEAKPMYTSEIRTTNSVGVRNADVLTFPNAGNVSATAGTVLMDVIPAFDIPNSSTPGYGWNYLMDFGASGQGKVELVNNQVRRYDSTTIVSTPAWTPLKNTTYKIGSRWGTTGQRNWLNGTSGSNGAFDGSINSGANMTIGGAGGGTTFNWGGNIKNLRIYKKALSDAQIVELTRLKEFSDEFSDEFTT